MKNKVKAGILTGLVMLSACSTENLWSPDTEELQALLPASAYPDFKTTSTVSFDISCGEYGRNVLLQFFTENPLAFDETEGQQIKGEAIYKIFTDGDGRFKADVDLPAGIDKLFVYTSAMGLMQLTEADINNGKVTLNLAVPRQKAAAPANSATRGTGSYKVWDLNSVGGIASLKAIVGWENNAYGKITQGNGLLDDGNLTPMDITALNTYFGSPYANLSQYRVGTDIVNTKIAPTFVNEEGQTVTTTSARVWVTYVGERGAWWQDGLGYYYYKTGQAPANRSEALANLTHYVVLPNMSTAGNVPYQSGNIGGVNPYNYGIDNAPAWGNERIQLLYFDEETGEATTEFPPGYTIGFFLLSKKDNSKDVNTDDTYQMAADYLWYSNTEWNSNGSHFIALKYDGKLIYGIEDGLNSSFNDLIFCVEADPAGTIIRDDIPAIPIDPDGEYATETRYFTYAFEDIWPEGGDYDLNDVIIEHKRELTFDKDNKTRKVADTFTAVQPQGSATYTDAFAIWYHQNQWGTITLPEGAVAEKDIWSVLVFPSAKDVRNKPFTIVREFPKNNNWNEKEKIERETNYSPYIISNYKGEEDNRTEVHLPKHSPTARANASQIGSAADAYYVNKDGLHPFALMLPVTHFTPVTETVSIEQEYPEYSLWVDSKMTKNTNWYLNYRK